MKLNRSETNRQEGKHQVSQQRNNILDAAEKLFLTQGLDNTRMVDIAREAGITKVTLYRYFPNRDVIAIEIHSRMMNKVASLIPPVKPITSLETAKELVHAMVQNYRSLHDVYRFMGMVDRIYLDNPPDTEIHQWAKKQLLSLAPVGPTRLNAFSNLQQGDHLLIIMSTVIWFLEKVAVRDEVTWSDQAVPLERHLQIFEEMILGYLDRLIDKERLNLGSN